MVEPIRKKARGSGKGWTTVGIRKRTLIILKNLAEIENTTAPELLRYLVEMADEEMIPLGEEEN